MPSEAIKTLRGFRQTREFQDRPVPDQVLTDILDVGRWSGSSKNTQPWSFLVVTDRPTIGRLAESDVMIDDKGVSRRHAQIRTKDGRSTLTDLGSTNGTKLNGQQVQSRPLSDGDRITVGNTVIEYRRV